MRFFKQKPINRQSGQTLVILLAFMATAIVITSAAAAVTVANITANSQYTFGENAYYIAKSGVEEAMLRITRDPSYTVTNGSLTVGAGTATITVSGSSTKTITSVGTSGNFKRTIQATATVNNYAVTLTAWSEI